MTDKVKGAFVCFDRDIRTDDAEFVLNAIRALKHVAAVEVHVVDHDDWFARSRVQSEVREKILALYESIGKGG